MKDALAERASSAVFAVIFSVFVPVGIASLIMISKRETTLESVIPEEKGTPDLMVTLRVSQKVSSTCVLGIVAISLDSMETEALAVKSEMSCATAIKVYEPEENAKSRTPKLSCLEA